jgi:thiamine monophosphate synthase
MSKGLEALESLETEYYTKNGVRFLEFRDDDERLDTIEKELKALEIIKEKDVDIYIFQRCETVDKYNSRVIHIVGETRELTQEEYDLLKEVLNDNSQE